ncbi:MarC family protein [Bdellovibrio sp. GT3]|uniref:MarC family protein n=1 Tax=Bdellovibrio sp. GT3 TaxID=3136282 RepID=UPI0030F06339
MDGNYEVGVLQVFTVFFIMMGPLRLLPMFASATAQLAPGQVRTLAVKSTFLAVPLFIVAGFVGQNLMEKWHIPSAILQITNGIIFAFVAFPMVLKFASANQKTGPQPEKELNPFSVVLNMITTAYGLGTLIMLLALSRDTQRTLLIFAALGAVLICNFLTMFFIRQLRGKAVFVTLQILGAFLGVLQASLAIEMIHKGWASLNG